MKSEIITNSETEIINWDIPQLLVSEDTNKVILSTGIHKASSFAGVSIYYYGYPIGEYSTEWAKGVFKPFKGQIKLSN